jgi:hypothetical protein
MRKGRLNSTLGFVLAGMLAGAMIAAKPVSAQNGRFRQAFQQRRPAAAAQKEPVKPPKVSRGEKAAPNLRAMDGLPPKWVDNMRGMSPEEQERFMQNDARFKNLPPGRQQQIRNNLQRWNSLSPEQQAEAQRREEALEHMTPDQRQYFTNVVGPRYQALPQARKQVINRHLAMLGQMSPETQQTALNDPRFTEGMSPDEQQTLRDLNSLRNPPTQ